MIALSGTLAHEHARRKRCFGDFTLLYNENVGCVLA